MAPVDKKQKDIFPSRSREMRELKNKEIRALYRIGYSMNDICRKTNSSKSTVFFAINHKYGITGKNLLKTKGRK